MSDHDLYYGDFDRDGEEAVRNRVALHQYNEKKHALALEWLRKRDQERSDASMAEQITLARSAKNAAWAAAIAAIIAAIAAIIALLGAKQ